MAAPFPYEATAPVVSDPIESEALHLYRNYSWLARLSDEMNNEPVLCRKRSKEFVDQVDLFRHWYEKLQARIADGSRKPADIAEVIERTFAYRKTHWEKRAEMASDLAAIYAGAIDLATWIDTNADGYKMGYSTNKVIGRRLMTDDPIKDEKPAGFSERVAAFRGLFAAKG